MDYGYEDEDDDEATLQQLFQQFVPQDDNTDAAQYSGMQGNLSPQAIRDKLIEQNPGAADMFAGGAGQYVDEPGPLENDDNGAPAANDFTGGPQNRAVRPQVTDDRDDFGASYGATGGAPSGAGMGSGLGQYRGRDIQHYDQGLPDRTAQTSQYIHGLADNRAARAVENQRGGIDLGSLPLRYATMGGVMLGSKWDTQGLVNSLNRRYDEENRADEQHISRAQRDEDIISKYVKDAYDSTRAEEEKDYSRNRDSIKDARDEEKFGFEKQKLAADIENSRGLNEVRKAELAVKLAAANKKAAPEAKYVDTNDSKIVWSGGDGSLYKIGEDGAPIKVTSSDGLRKIGEKDSEEKGQIIKDETTGIQYRVVGNRATPITLDGAPSTTASGGAGSSVPQNVLRSQVDTTKGTDRYGNPNKDVADGINSMFGNVRNAQSNVESLSRAEGLLTELEQSKTNIPDGGIGSNIQQGISEARNWWAGKDVSHLATQKAFTQAVGEAESQFTKSANEGQGSVSEGERKMFKSQFGAAVNSPEAARLALGNWKAKNLRDIDMATSWKNAVENEGKSPRDFTQWQQEYITSHPLDAFGGNSTGRRSDGSGVGSGGVMSSTTSAAPSLSRGNNPGQESASSGLQGEARAQTLANARAALQRGKSRSFIESKLRAAGIDPGEL